MTNLNTKRTYWPTKGWQASTPEEQGVDSELLARACDFIMENELHIHSMLIIRHGYIVADVYFHPFNPNTLHDLASCTKSFTSTLVGIAIDKGYIKGVKQPVLNLLQGRNVANVDNRKKAMTLENLLTMSSGLACYAEPGEVTLREMTRSPDWAQFTLDLPMIEPPGTRFEYCSPASHLLSAIVRESTGMTTLDFARKHLFEPLGITEAIWPVSPRGVNHGWGNLHLAPHNMAKLGYLFLNKGQWDSQQIVSSEWVTSATSKHSTPPDIYIEITDGYGYQWWLFSPESYFAFGRGGQMIIVMPDLDTVVVFTAGLSAEEGPKRDESLTSILVPAIKSTTPLPPNPNGVALLESKTHQATLPQDKPEPVPPLPPIAQRMSGHTYEVDANPLGLTAFSLTFPKTEEALLSLSIRNLTLKLKVGLDNVFRITPRGKFNLPTALRGSWKADNIFAFNWDEVGNINTWQISMAFENDRVVVQMKEATGLSSITINGKLK